MLRFLIDHERTVETTMRLHLITSISCILFFLGLGNGFVVVPRQRSSVLSTVSSRRHYAEAIKQPYFDGLFIPDDNNDQKPKEEKHHHHAQALKLNFDGLFIPDDNKEPKEVQHHHYAAATKPFFDGLFIPDDDDNEEPKEVDHHHAPKRLVRWVRHRVFDRTKGFLNDIVSHVGEHLESIKQKTLPRGLFILGLIEMFVSTDDDDDDDDDDESEGSAVEEDSGVGLPID